MTMTTTTHAKQSCLNMGKYALKFENVEFDEEDRVKAKRELRETPEIVQASLRELRELVKKEPKFVYPFDDDFQLQIFLRPCKYYPESAMDRMRKYYKYKLDHPVYSKDLVPSCEKRAFRANLFTFLPGRSKNGERVLLLEIGHKWVPSECTLVEILRSTMLAVEAAIAEPKTQVAGVHVVADMAGLTLHHVLQMSPSFAKHIVDFVQDCVPIRVKGIHIVNQPFVFNMVYALFKPFLTDKLQKRIHFHGSSYESLHEHVAKSILPLKYLGTADIPLDMGSELHDYLMCYENDFAERLKYGYTK